MNNTLTRLLRQADGLALLLLSGFILRLLLAGTYWQYLNPKFAPLSYACAGVLGLLGIFILIKPLAKPSLSRIAAYAVLAGLCFFSQNGIERASQGTGYWEGKPIDKPEVLPSRVTLSGHEYTRINLGELYDIAGKNQSDAMRLNYAMRGFVARTPELDATGEFVLYRMAMYCCFADSTAVGIRVKPSDGALPQAGQWIVVFGKLAELEKKGEPNLKILDASFTSVLPSHYFAADKLETAQPDGPGFMYEWREAEPYAY